MATGYVQPLYYSTEFGFEIEVEFAVRTIKLTQDEHLRKELMLELHQHLLDYPCPLLSDVLRGLNQQYGHRRYEKPPTSYDNPQPGMSLPNQVFVLTTTAKSVNRQTGKVEEVEMAIDMWKLRKWIIEHFTPTRKYHWFALWKFFKEKDLLKTDEVRAFAHQMNEWFEQSHPDTWTAMPSDRSINHYMRYLGDTHHDQWNKQTFMERKKKEASSDGYDDIVDFFNNHFYPFSLIGLKKDSSAFDSLMQ